MRKALLVLGMHRSGTSAMAGALDRMGATVGTQLVGPGRNNAGGYYESRPILNAMEELLQACGSFWHDWRQLDLSAAPDDELAAIREKLLKHLEAEFGATSLFTVKDPRNCRAVGFWRELLQSFDSEVFAIVVVRRPTAVWRSLEIRNGIGFDKAALLWLRHMLDAEAATRDVPRAFVDYDALLTDPYAALVRVGELLGEGWTAEAVSERLAEHIKPSLRHHAGDADHRSELDALAPWFNVVWETLSRYAAEGRTDGDEATLDAVAADFARCSAPFAQHFAAIERLVAGLERDLGRIRSVAEQAAARLAPAPPAKPRQAAALVAEPAAPKRPDPVAQAAFARSREALAGDRAEEALAAAREAAEKAPDNAGFATHLGHLLLRAGLRDEARAALVSAVERAPELAAAQFRLAQLEHADGRLTEALDRIGRAMALRPGEASYVEFASRLSRKARAATARAKPVESAAAEPAPETTPPE
jgi:hypothetical protein